MALTTEHLQNTKHILLFERDMVFINILKEMIADIFQGNGQPLPSISVGRTLEDARQILTNVSANNPDKVVGIIGGKLHKDNANEVRIAAMTPTRYLSDTISAFGMYTIGLFSDTRLAGYHPTVHAVLSKAELSREALEHLLMSREEQPLEFPENTPDNDNAAGKIFEKGESDLYHDTNNLFGGITMNIELKMERIIENPKENAHKLARIRELAIPNLRRFKDLIENEISRLYIPWYPEFFERADALILVWLDETESKLLNFPDDLPTQIKIINQLDFDMRSVWKCLYLGRARFAPKPAE